MRRHPIPHLLTCVLSFLLSPHPSGSLPSSWSSLKDLVGLDVSHNRISGTLPSTWGDLTALKVCVCAGTPLSGKRCLNQRLQGRMRDSALYLLPRPRT